jgi:hypothetical protein
MCRWTWSVLYLTLRASDVTRVTKWRSTGDIWIGREPVGVEGLMASRRDWISRRIVLALRRGVVWSDRVTLSGWLVLRFPQLRACRSLVVVDLLIPSIITGWSGSASRPRYPWRWLFVFVAVGRFRGSYRGPSRHYSQSIPSPRGTAFVSPLCTEPLEIGFSIKNQGSIVYTVRLKEWMSKSMSDQLSPLVDSTGIISEAAALFLVRRCLVTLMWFELWLLRNEAATSEIIPALCMRRTKLIGNQLGLHVVNIASCIPSRRRIKLPLHYNNLHKVLM